MRSGGTTSLVPDIGNSARHTVFNHISDDGSRLLFHTDAGLLSSDTNNAEDIYMASLATGYPRPVGASPSRMALVPAYTSCSSPNRLHGPPLSFGSCAPPAQTSGNLTAGTPDANGAGANQTGYVRITPVVGTLGPPDNSDVSFPAPAIGRALQDRRVVRRSQRHRGVRLHRRAAGYVHRPHHRQVQRRLLVPQPATVIDLPLAFTATCATTASTAAGGACSATTSLNAITPGAIKDGGRIVLEFTQIQVRDGGPDGLVSSGPNDLYAVQGVFAP